MNTQQKAQHKAILAQDKAKQKQEKSKVKSFLHLCFLIFFCTYHNLILVAFAFATSDMIYNPLGHVMEEYKEQQTRNLAVLTQALQMRRQMEADRQYEADKERELEQYKAEHDEIVAMHEADKLQEKKQHDEIVAMHKADKEQQQDNFNRKFLYKRISGAKEESRKQEVDRVKAIDDLLGLISAYDKAKILKGQNLETGTLFTNRNKAYRDAKDVSVDTKLMFGGYDFSTPDTNRLVRKAVIKINNWLRIPYYDIGLTTEYVIYIEAIANQIKYYSQFLREASPGHYIDRDVEFAASHLSAITNKIENGITLTRADWKRMQQAVKALENYADRVVRNIQNEARTKYGKSEDAGVMQMYNNVFGSSDPVQ
ncbi:hypothetical protein Fsol_00455 [Candidatus Fokinia solitaria]|uniref:Uncharacterized protein n=1 Tax=Candidatus Fokinia solitaria TaxID=1802984 RepID=A0A2U8BSJ3_9RICK|nr:hypothetical protein [Candidatus Fokinia solitaria]AWD33250.1 hypothetical protein Fsol_00455 [Candidatus Fokinia solitaria]